MYNIGDKILKAVQCVASKALAYITQMNQKCTDHCVVSKPMLVYHINYGNSYSIVKQGKITCKHNDIEDKNNQSYDDEKLDTGT